MKCSPLFLTSPTVVWKESFRLVLIKDYIIQKIMGLNPLSGKESFRLSDNEDEYTSSWERLNPLSGKESFRLCK